ncbi:hypothetical protein [Methylobacterium sp. NEAU K]|uniref:hypothetical protein n=1 Tax=Methylobacterium sp. NEAU K TaxID=3064946 RepID=UPI0027363E73|nr:hypothetical protein [Methylobacterium sp. NEAU K]MDP4006307.1 hypothetical protein [Methylobacterium sp. NEAU K]
MGLVLLAGACSRLTNVPTTYSALPPVSASALAAAPADVVADLPPVVIPGTMRVPATDGGSRGVNPTAALDASRHTRLAWEALRPADLLKPPALAAASRGRSSPADVTETAATATRASSIDKPAAIATLTDDREATMERLLKGGRNAASAICSGC